VTEFGNGKEGQRSKQLICGGKSVRGTRSGGIVSSSRCHANGRSFWSHNPPSVIAMATAPALAEEMALATPSDDRNS